MMCLGVVLRCCSLQGFQAATSLWAQAAHGGVCALYCSTRVDYCVIQRGYPMHVVVYRACWHAIVCRLKHMVVCVHYVAKLVGIDVLYSMAIQCMWWQIVDNGRRAVTWLQWVAHGLCGQALQPLHDGVALQQLPLESSMGSTCAACPKHPALVFGCIRSPAPFCGQSIFSLWQVIERVYAVFSLYGLNHPAVLVYML